MRTSSLILVMLLSIASPPLLAQHQHGSAAPASGAPVELGSISFPNSGSTQAQPHFLRGLLLLHSFEFESALQAFAQARKIDPGFAMAYWGEAMAHNHPIWGEQDTAAARHVLNLLGPDAAQRKVTAPTPREQAYLAALEQLYFGTGDKAVRDLAYSESMGRIATRFPEDLDARALHALSILGLTGARRDIANYMRAAAVAEEVYAADPRHPGALHYLIHAYDDPIHAPLGLRAARVYASVAPAAPHAQHMPAHIFFALGLWEEAAAANTAAAETARAQGGMAYHPLHWLQHARLQQGLRAEAAELVQLMDRHLRDKPNPGARTHLAMMRATWLVETRGADMDSMGGTVDRAEIVSIGPFAALEFARGLAFVERGDLANARQSLASLRALESGGRTAAGKQDETASRYAAVDPSEILSAQIMDKMLQASLAFAEGRKDDALLVARQAATIEDAAQFEYGPPATVKPAHELLGELLVRNGKPDEASLAFARVLERYPNRALTLESLEALRR